MYLQLYPSVLKGHLSAPSSKSLTHRALICAAFSQGKSEIYLPLLCTDIKETIFALKVLGAQFVFYEDKVVVSGINLKKGKSISLNIFESASTLRFLVPVLSIFSEEIVINTSSRLIERLQTDDLAALSGLNFLFLDNLIKVSGSLNAQTYQLKTNLTTQWFSGMAIALPYLPFGTALRCEENLLSNSYLRLTLEVCRAFGIAYKYKNQAITLEKESAFIASKYKIEGDYSAAANWLVAAIFNPNLKINNLNPDSNQTDVAIFKYLEAMGISFKSENGEYTYESGEIRGAALDIISTPDLFPILAVLGALGRGRLIIQGIQKLPYKESNRLQLMVEGLKKLGAKIEFIDNEVIIEGQDYLEGAALIETKNDHRLIMAFAILATRVKKPFQLTEYTGITKSYPDFFDKYVNLGGKVRVV
ncbi:MAG: 3-phosphoshikimate 1-carboxyvinyltransferase [Bacilli bacterium]|nr:3-phosphoshikimate 1-carboxyvinyltransferase [Bacilli bacterium]